MKKNIAKRTAALAGFLVVMLIVLYLLQKLLMPKYMSDIPEGAMVEEYYKETTDHEVLFVGDCEVYENFSPITLYEDYGITSYIRGSAQQLTWQSYYLLEDALRYETPKVVVFNVLAMKYNEPQSEAYNRMSIDGMKMSPSKIGAIQASMTEEEHMLDYIFPILRYHSRWSELSGEDVKYMFHKDQVSHNGYYMRVDVRPADGFPEPEKLSDYTLGDKAMAYLDKMRELCQEKGIELVLVKSPSLYPYWYDEWDEQICAYAETYGLDYFNYEKLAPEIGIDYNTDTYDAGLHLNLSGAEKLSRYFGAYLTENYDLTDYREDPEYAEVYAEKIRLYDEMREAQYKELEEYGEIISF
ncbi:MAG TPA: SGNH/GDSL hydrolase family protein [Candidatus Mediterraneibacter excrementavium]|nr:SGNH/GDSL hydrolase family protein [Candidatus Mediterraneibacter excrementavium]